MPSCSESGSDGEDWCISFDSDGRLCTPAAAELDYSFDVFPAFVDPKEVDVEALKLDCQWAGFPLASKARSTTRSNNARPRFRSRARLSAHHNLPEAHRGAGNVDLGG
jgi:hypothetical protein